MPASSSRRRRHAHRPDELLEPEPRDLALLLGGFGDLGLGVVAQPTVERLEHLAGALARRVDQEHPAESLLVRAVPLLEPAEDLVVRGGRARLLAERPRGAAVLTDPRVSGERVQAVLLRYARPGVVRALQQALKVGERPALAKARRPRARAATEQDALLEDLRRLRVEPSHAERAPPFVGHASVDPEPGHAAVGMDVEPDVARAHGRIDREREASMRAEPAVRKRLGPLRLTGAHRSHANVKRA